MSEVKLNREIHNVVVLDNEWMCNEHPDTILEFHHLSSQYEYYHISPQSFFCIFQ